MKKIHTFFFTTVFCFNTHAQTPTLQWAQQIMNATGPARVVDIATDAIGNVYITGDFISSHDFDPGPGTYNLTSGSGTTKDLFYAKYSPSGSLVWAFDFGSPATDEFGKSIAVKGNYVYVGSTESGFVSIRKIDLSGTVIWNQTYAPGTSGRVLSEITVDNADNVYICGEYSQSEIWSFVRKYSPSGGVIQTMSIGDFAASATQGLTIFSITTDNSGGVYITGNYNYPVTFPGFGISTPYPYGAVYNPTQFLARLDSNLLVGCSYVYNISRETGTANLAHVTDKLFYNVCYDGTSNTIVLQGVFSGSSQDFDPGAGTYIINPVADDHFIAKYTLAGGFMWAINFLASGFNTEADISLDNLGNIYFTGELTAATVDMHPSLPNPVNTKISTTSDILFAKYDPTNALLWSTNLGGSTSVAYTHGICSDPAGTEVFLGGAQTRQIDFDPAAPTVLLGNTNSVGTGYYAKYATCTVPPTQPGGISGNTTICSGSGNTYSVAPVAGASSYTWTFPSGWSGTSTTNSVNATASATTGFVMVTANNACGNSTPQMVNVTVNTAPATPGSISGNATVCASSSNTYSITSVPGATSYTWTLPGTWSGSSTTNSINATAGASGGTISVIANNTCGSSAGQTLNVSINSVPNQPSSITGNTTICAGTSQPYSVTNDVTATSYTWTLPATWSGSSTTNSINSTAGTAGGTITVTANNSCGSSTSQTLNVTVNSLPTVTLTLNTTSVCIDNAVFAFAGGAPAGGTFSGTGVTGGNFNAATAGVGTHTITYSFTDGNGCTNTNTDQITVNNCTGILNSEISNIEIYPNPTNGIVRLSGVEACGECSLVILDVLGKIVYRAPMTNVPMTIDLGEANPGMYFMQIKNENIAVIKKIIKE